MTRLSLLLILILAAQVQAQTGRLMVAEPPKPATVEGYEKGHCVALSGRIRICKLLSESEDAVFLFEKEGKTVGTWRVEPYIGETDDFNVMRGDLDGDRKPELIVANRDATSVGLGASIWTIAIFPDSDLRSFQPPLSFSVNEFGPRGSFVANGGSLSILTTDWVWGKDPKGRRGDGLYLVGQWWRYHRGELLLLPQNIIARRYLFSFSNERFATWDSDRIPYRWLSNRHTEFVTTEFGTGRGDNGSRGVIESVSITDESSPYRLVKIRFKPDGGQTSELVYQNGGDNNPIVEMYFGDAASGRVYPHNYLPSDPKKWLTGRRATLRTYADKKSEILWLEPRRRTN